MKYSPENERIIIYIFQERRNIGIINKLKIYELQGKCSHTIEVFLKPALAADG